MSQSYSFLDCAAGIVGPGGALQMGAGSGNDEGGITVSPTGEINTMQVGADGSGQHSLHADKSGTVTVRLLKTSPMNAVLMAMYNFQTASANAHGQNTILITDTQRGDVITCTQAAFSKVPDLNYAKVAGMNEWVFQAVSIIRTLGA